MIDINVSGTLVIDKLIFTSSLSSSSKRSLLTVITNIYKSIMTMSWREYDWKYHDQIKKAKRKVRSRVPLTHERVCALMRVDKTKDVFLS